MSEFSLARSKAMGSVLLGVASGFSQHLAETAQHLLEDGE
jgi:hypothetical protein